MHPSRASSLSDSESSLSAVLPLQSSSATGLSTPSSSTLDQTSDREASLVDPMVAYNSCTKLSGNVSLLLQDANDALMHAQWDRSGEVSMDTTSNDDKAHTMEHLLRMNVRVLEAMERSLQVQASMASHSFHTEDKLDDVRGEIGRSQSVTKRLLYRTREHIRKERESLRDELNTTTSPLVDEVHKLASCIAQLQARHTGFDAELSQLALSLQNVVDELDRIRRSALAFRVRAFVIRTSSKAAVYASCAMALVWIALSSISSFLHLCYCGMRFTLLECPDLYVSLLVGVLLEEQARAVPGPRASWEDARARALSL